MVQRKLGNPLPLIGERESGRQTPGSFGFRFAQLSRNFRIRFPFRASRNSGAHHDRCHPSEGAPDGGEPLEQGAVPRRIGRTKGGLNSKLHAVCDGEGRPVVFLLSGGEMSDHKGARLIVDALPRACALIDDRGYDSDWFREALAKRGCKSCMPSIRAGKFRCPMTGRSISSTTKSKICAPS